MKTKRLSGKIITLVFILLAITAALCLYFFYSPRQIFHKPLLKHEGLPPAGSRLLIIAPHCDDETLGLGILISRALKAGLKVKVVIVTNGDGFTLAVDENFFTLRPSSQEYRRFGSQRQQESRTALAALGLNSSDIYFLGYPDTGVAHLWTEYWDSDKRFFSRYTQTNVSPYTDSFNKAAPYTGVSLLSDLERIIREYQPTHIYYPHPNDRHPDHWSVNAFVKYMLEANKLGNIQEKLYLVHRGNWPVPKLPRPNMKLNPPAKLTGLGTVWSDFPFRPGEADLKKMAILKYRTQIKAMKEFLLAFVRSSELFGHYPDVVIPKLSQAPDGINHKILAIADPVGDMLTRDVDESADIKAIYSYVANNRWVIELAADRPVTKNIIYRIHARIFYDAQPVKRFDLTYYQGNLALKKYARNSVLSIPGIKTININGRWRIEIPVKSLGDPRSVFINADCGISRFNTDRTAWRMLRFKD